MQNRVYSLLGLFLFFIVLANCGGAQGRPVALPVPFAGAYTGDTTLVIANGNPVGGGGSLNLAIKNQQNKRASISWEIFDGSNGTSRGALTFQLDTMTQPVVTTIDGKIKREYFLGISADIGRGNVISVSQFHCFENPSTLPPPTFDPTAIVPDDPGAIAVTREMVCSGLSDGGSENIEKNQVIEGRFVMGMIQLSNGDFRFQTQVKSALYLQGAEFFAEAGDPSDEILVSVVAEGFGVMEAGNDQQIFTPIFVLGTDEAVGVEIDTLVEMFELSSEIFDAIIDVELSFGDAKLVVHNIHIREQAVPELSSVLTDAIQERFEEGVHFSSSLINNGVAFLTVVGEEGPDHDPINCDEQEGRFKELCNQFSPLKLNYRCLILLDPSTFEVFTFHGSWIVSRDLP